MSQDVVHQPSFLPHVFIAALEANLERVVLEDPNGRQVTGRQLAQDTSCFVQALREAGVNAESRVAVLSTNRVEVLHVMHALMLMGSLYTPLHPMGAVDDFVFIVDDGAIDTIVFDPKFETAVAEIAHRSPRRLTLLSLGVTAIGDDLIASAMAKQPAPLAAPDLSGDEIYRLSYSGGTTGKPKASQSTHRTALTMTQIQMAEWEWPDEVRQLLVAPLSHTGGVMFIPTLLRGGTFFVIPGFDPVAVMEAIEKHRITCVLMVPTMIYALLDHPSFNEFDLTSLETIFYGASPMSVPRLREGIRRLGPIFFQFYGQVECAMTMTVLRRGEHLIDDDRRLASCGRPVPWIRVALLDGDGTEVRDGELGEICARGPLVHRGYLNRPELDADTFRDGWHHTGDIAVRDPDGFLRIVDRAKDMVITGGFNVFPREVEDALEAHPAVARAAVFGTPDARWGEMVTAAIVLREGSEVTPDELSAYVRSKKGPHQTPKVYHFVDGLPLTALGKPDKKALRSQFC